jgi:hypothetical protein
MLELADSIISAPDSLRALFAPDANANMCFCDHWDIVGPISNRESDPITLVLCQRDHICFLAWGYTAADD